MPWICGGRALTMNGPTKRWGCAARAKSTSLADQWRRQLADLAIEPMEERIDRLSKGREAAATTLPQHESGRLVCRAQAHRRGCDGSLVRSPPAGPGGFSDEKFYSGGYPPE